MGKSILPRGSRNGFTLMETMFAIFILSVGVLALAALMSRSSADTERSRYMATATLLASEKLEDLNRYSVNDPVIAVTSGTTAGSLTSDSGPSTVTVGGVTENVAYFDTVRTSSGNGAVSETLTGVNGGGTTQYTTVTQTPDGNNTSATSTTAPTASADSLIYNRRWIIEKDTPVVGVRRITVLVTLQNGPTTAPVSFQTSMVRP